MCPLWPGSEQRLESEGKQDKAHTACFQEGGRGQSKAEPESWSRACLEMQHEGDMVSGEGSEL